jgi:hypothetical protein
MFRLKLPRPECETCFMSTYGVWNFEVAPSNVENLWKTAVHIHSVVKNALLRFRSTRTSRSTLSQPSPTQVFFDPINISREKHARRNGCEAFM